jgi:hypothetical protein
MHFIYLFLSVNFIIILVIFGANILKIDGLQTDIINSQVQILAQF